MDHGVGRRGKGDAAAFLRRAAEALGISVEALAGRSKTQTIVRAREVIAAVGVERCGLGVGELARSLGMHPGSASRWIARAAVRRREDASFASRCEELEEVLGRR